ncbi:MAG TPA: response regulator transcription factor [Clostridiales bacterium]|nr:response regulator transcription factor [Clostridiales bacterium]
MQLKVIIVDDEPYAIKELKYLLEEYSDFEICGEAQTREECLRLVAREQPDVVFLDIELQGENGINIAKEINKINSDIYIVFATAYSQYAVDAFTVDAFDYILKPFEDERIIEVVEKIRQRVLPKRMPDFITAWKDDRMVVLSPDEIVYFCIDDGKTVLKSLKGEYIVPTTLSNLEEKLKSFDFMRTHKSFVVNLKYIKEIVPWFNHTYVLVMKGYEDDEVPVSRTYMKKFKDAMQIG